MNSNDLSFENTVTSDELVFWMLLAHLPGWKYLITNRLVVDILLNKRMLLSEFFCLPTQKRIERFHITEQQEVEIQNALKKISEYKSVLSELEKEGIQIVTLNSPFFPKALKQKLKMASCPLILYCKGHLNLLNRPASAIVGSRKANAEALEFTDLTSRRLTREGQIVVSGYAKGVDQQALKSALESEGSSIIVLPQGLFTFKSELRKFSDQISRGTLLVCSFFPPKAPWSVGLAMGRNTHIYALSQDVFVAQTESSGGTWTGAVNGLKRKQRVFIYFSSTMDSKPLRDLIKLGAIPIRKDGSMAQLP